MSLLNHIYRIPKLILIAIGVALIALAGFIDYLTGPNLSFLIFYLIAVFFFIWFTTKSAGILASVVCALIWLVENLRYNGSLFHLQVSYLNVSIELIFFFLIVYLLCELKEVLGINEELGHMDILTGAINRAAFYELAEREIHRLARYKRPLTVANVDIDNLKVVNYQFGYPVGDQLLRSVSQSIKANLRKVDSVSRFGGDEFAVLLPETGAEAAQVVLSRIRNVLLNMMEQNKWPVTFSFGTVTFLKPPVSVEEMMKKVGTVMYAAKDSGMNTVEQEVVSA